MRDCGCTVDVRLDNSLGMWVIDVVNIKDPSINGRFMLDGDLPRMCVYARRKRYVDLVMGLGKISIDKHKKLPGPMGLGYTKGKGQRPSLPRQYGRNQRFKRWSSI